ncbi:hypothetical protein Tsubulata_015947 [Turnera subulata]|uniref:WAT1-related protein n=1 Tax=Turnera subulata TaxID=218843 RepID=A0A9Q0JL99_9ROSI|nr:hypothetical protein Tsubulata_015947 [Turnera subulata]
MAVFDFFPFLAMVVVQVGYAGMNTTTKLAMDYANMKPLVLVAYRQIFATIALLPFAYYLERKTRPKITLPLLFQIFLCSLTGIVGNQVLFNVGMEHSSLTISTALTNILPAVTFLLAAIFRQEKVGIKRLSGQAKVLGTVLCVGGAMFLTFYKGPIVNIGESKINWKYANDSTGDGKDSSNSVFGSLIVIASTFSWAVWYIIQVRVSEKFPAPYTSTLLMCFMGSIQCVVIGAGVNHRASDWALNSGLRLVATIYAGVVCSALAFSLTSWTIQRKGALYVSVFSPLLLILVAILGWALLHEKIYVGTVVGSVLIIAGLYVVLWGKDRETKVTAQETDTKILPEEKVKNGGDLESQLPAESSGDESTQQDIGEGVEGKKKNGDNDDVESQLPPSSIGNNHAANN